MQLRVQFWGLLFVSLSVLCTSTTSWGLGYEFERSFAQELALLAAKSPPYVWGGADDKGADCSGMVYLAARRAGIPGVRRTTSKNMAYGLGGWTSVDFNTRLFEAEPLDIVFFTWSERPDRPFGHVGVFVIGPKSGLLELQHASSGVGRTVIVPFKGKLFRDLTKIRRLTIGDRGGKPPAEWTKKP